MTALENRHASFQLMPSRKTCKILLCVSVLCAFVVAACSAPRAVSQRRGQTNAPRANGAEAVATPTPKPVYESPVLESLVAAANERATHEVEYDPTYYKLDYPGGDV